MTGGLYFSYSFGQPLIWEKTFILCRFFSGKAKLVRAEKYRYHIVVKWYLLKMDLGFKYETNKWQNTFSWIFWYFSIRLENILTLEFNNFIDITLTIFLLHTMKDSLVWSYQNTHNLNESDRFSMFNNCSKLRDFKIYTFFENLSTSDGQHLWQNDQNNLYEGCIEKITPSSLS